MGVTRISKETLVNILKGNTVEPTTCIIKFYSNKCHYCHKLKEYYETLADDYEDLHFFAFNIQDGHELENQIGFNGVPSIIKIKTGASIPQVDILGPPATPNKFTYYTSNDIKGFIEENLQNE